MRKQGIQCMRVLCLLVYPLSKCLFAAGHHERRIEAGYVHHLAPVLGDEADKVARRVAVDVEAPDRHRSVPRRCAQVVERDGAGKRNVRGAALHHESELLVVQQAGSTRGACP